MLIGVDLKKDRELLHAAYNDAAGVTAAFNLNLLARINRELDADFDLTINSRTTRPTTPVEGTIEICIRSLADQIVTVAGQRFHSPRRSASIPKIPANTASTSSRRWRAAPASRRAAPGPTTPTLFAIPLC